MKFFYWIGCRKFYQKALSYAAPPFRWENINSKDPFKTPSFFHTQHGPEWNNEYFYMWHFSELRATTAVAPFLPSDLKSWWFLFPIHLFNICIIILQLKASLIVKIEALGCWKRMRERVRNLRDHRVGERCQNTMSRWYNWPKLLIILNVSLEKFYSGSFAYA